MIERIRDKKHGCWKKHEMVRQTEDQSQFGCTLKSDLMLLTSRVRQHQTRCSDLKLSK